MSTDMESILRQMSNENTAKTFDFNRVEAEKSRNWQKEMSDTSHQREVEDLKRAGLNPVLSANGGAQAYSASSASGSADTSAVGALASIYQTKMNNDNAKKIAEMQIKQQQADNKNALKIAKINAAASNYSANQSYSASRYASDTSYASSVYGTNNSKYGLVSQFVNGATGSKSSNAGKTLGQKIKYGIGKYFAEGGSDERVRAFGRKLMK